MKKVIIVNGTVESVVKNIFWLAWQASECLGMGRLQNKPGATIDMVWDNVVTSGDYTVSHDRPGEPSADYVFGRMMKLRLKYDDVSISYPDSEPRPDYQSWCRKYPTYEALINAAMK